MIKTYHNVGRDLEGVRMIFIETVTACNLRCSYCPNSIYERGLVKNMKKMKTRLFYKIIDELSGLKWCGEIQPHFYGEPLLDKRITSLIKYAKNKITGVKINLFTNGELLTVDLYKKLIKAGVDIFTVTQHLTQAAKGIFKIIAYRKRIGTDKVVFYYQKLDFYFNRAGLIKFKNGRRPGACYFPSAIIGIDYAGNVLICCNDYLNEVKLGNVAYERLIDIWNRPSYRKMRHDISKGKFKLGICRRCYCKAEDN